MKNLLILGLTALVLFSVSAGLSVWLNQTKASAEAAQGDGKKANGKEKETDKGEKPAEAKPAPKGEAPSDAATKDALANDVRDREARLARRQAQLEVIFKDIQSERDRIDELTRQVVAEAKAVGDRDAQLLAREAALAQKSQATDKTAADIKTKQGTLDANEVKNIARMVDIYEAMPPDNSAKLLQQMADGGKLDTAVKILVGLKPRTAAKVLPAIEALDPALSTQLMDRMRQYQRPAPPG